MSAPITRREFCERALGLGLSASAIGALLAACGTAGKKAATYSPSPMATTLPDKLRVHVSGWSEPFPHEVTEGFERLHGMKVVYSNWDDGEALVSKLKAGGFGYDLVLPKDYMVHVMGSLGLLQPLDLSLIPNVGGVVPIFAQPAFDIWPDGRRYGVPLRWYAAGIGVRADKVQEPITSWTQLWDGRYKGQINMLNDERETIAAGLLKNHFSCNTIDQSQLDKAISDLIAQRQLVRRYDSIGPKQAMVDGVPLVHCWSRDAVAARKAGLSREELAFVLPEEGFTVSVENLCIPIGALSPYAAHLFMNYLCDAVVNAKAANGRNYFSAIGAASSLAKEPIANLVPTAVDLERGEIINDVGAFAVNYSDAWGSVKSA